MNDDPILNNRKAALYLGCSESMLNKLRVTGGGPVFIKIGAMIGYRKSSLDIWTRERSFRSTTEFEAQRQPRLGDLGPTQPDTA
jgi:predicted DNA-binding transcriptional regulator AlpA